MENWQPEGVDLDDESQLVQAEELVLNLTILGSRDDLIALLEEMARIQGCTVIDGSFTPLKILKPKPETVSA